MRQGCLVFLRESRSRKDISEVRGEILGEKGMPLTARNTSSLVIDSLCDKTEEENVAVAGFYCDFLAQQEQTVNIMGAMLKQLVGRGGISEDLRKAFQKAKKEFGGRGPRLVDLMGMLRTTIASIPRVFLCVDALDELLPKYLPALLGSLRDIVRESPTMRIFCTGRPHIKDDIQKYFAKGVVIPINPNNDDSRNYVEMRLGMDAKLEAMSKGLRADIVRVIQGKISDICVGPFGISTLLMIYTY